MLCIWKCRTSTPSLRELLCARLTTAQMVILPQLTELDVLYHHAI